MRYRRIGTFLLGLWLGAGVLMAWVAIESFRSVDRLLSAPSPVAAIQIKSLGPDGARALFRYEAAEQNRALFQTWGSFQLILAVGFFSFLLFGSSEGKFSLLLALLMLLIVAVQRLAMTPELASLGRGLDFIPSEVPSLERNRFWMLHSLYTGSEIVKWGLGLVLGARLVFRYDRRLADARNEFDVIDKANYRHINR
jgi:hypothetical protein